MGEVDRVELYIDDKLKETVEKEPYEWLWNEMAFWEHEIKAVAYDNFGNTVSDSIAVWIFNV
jgi:hypothetical protein